MKAERENYCMHCHHAFTKENPIGAFKAEKDYRGMRTGYLCLECSGGPTIKPQQIATWNQKHPFQEEEDEEEEQIRPTIRHETRTQYDVTWEGLLERLEIKRRQKI